MSADALRRVRGEEIAIIFQNALASLTPTLAIGDQLAEVYRAHRGMDEATARAAALRSPTIASWPRPAPTPPPPSCAAR